MVSLLILLIIGLPWLGALLVWFARDSRPRLQHNLAVSFSLTAGLASLALLLFYRQGGSLSIPMGNGSSNDILGLG